MYKFFRTTLELALHCRQGLAIGLFLQNNCRLNQNQKDFLVRDMGVSPERLEVVEGESASFEMKGAFIPPNVKFKWDFGDGDTSSLQNPSHTYTEPNLYTVILTASNAYGSDTITETACVLAMAPQLHASFTQSAVFGQPPLSVSFTDTSTGQPTSWLWSFGDGNNSTEQNPTHIYERAGNFPVGLTVSNFSGSDTTTNSFFIRSGWFRGDLNYDGTVDFEDLLLFSDDWLHSNGICLADIAPAPNGDGIVDFDDFALFAQNWLQSNSP